MFVPRSAIRKNGVQFGNSEPIRENQAIRANLRIDLRESGHQSFEHHSREFCSAKENADQGFYVSLKSSAPQKA